ncbi:alpha/beta hydrolase family protein [Marinicrinis sediminis]|uniref:Alpha/beta hydrolase family protein n=1 Tax=Marinicrinis sediminis TaxID=1652465 RepID=A0ABW5RE93_9BACL
MKKLWIIFVGMMLLAGTMLLAGCANEPQTNHHSAKQNQNQMSNTPDNIDKGDQQETDPDESHEQVNLTLEETALSYVRDLFETNYGTAYTDYAHDEVMTSQVNATIYQALFEDLKANQGEMVRFSEVWRKSEGTYTIIAVPVELSKENVNVDVYFNDRQEIAGLQFAMYQEGIEIEMPVSIMEEELVSNVNGFELGGTLTLPIEGDRFPVVVLVHGSGATDRDETILSNKPFRDLAWGLAEQGIAVYRYDKRNYTYPEVFAQDIEGTLYEETIDDAVAIVKILQSVQRIDPDQIFVLGHSIGGYAMPRIAEDSREAAGFIIMAGPARGHHELIPEQVEYLVGLDGEVDETDQAQIEAVNKEIAKLDEIDTLAPTEKILGMYKTYVQDLIAYDPVEKASSITKPVLLLQGERDYQVTMEDYQQWYEAFSSKRNWTFQLYPKLNHLMMPGEGKPTNQEYTQVNSVDAQVMTDVAAWIQEMTSNTSKEASTS